METTQDSNFQTQGVLPLPGTLHRTVKIRKSMPRQDAEDWAEAMMRVWRKLLVVHAVIALFFEFVEMDTLERLIHDSYWIRHSVSEAAMRGFHEVIYFLMDVKAGFRFTAYWMVGLETLILHVLGHAVVSIFAKPPRAVLWCYNVKQSLLGLVNLDQKSELSVEDEHVWPVPVSVELQGLEDEPVLRLVPAMKASEAKGFTSTVPWPRRFSMPLAREDCAMGLSVDPEDEHLYCLEIRHKEYGTRFQVRVEATDVEARSLHHVPAMKTWPVALEPTQRLAFLGSLRVMMDVHGLDGPELTPAKETRDV